MKKIAVVLYPGFCMFEFSAALETLALARQCSITVFGEKAGQYRSEEGLLAVAEYHIDQLDVSQYDGLILTGFDDEEVSIIKNQLFLDKIREFHRQGKVLAAISAGPVFLVKAGVLKGLSYMCACPKEGLREEGFTDEELEGLLFWDECYPDLKFLRHGNIVTSMAYGFREWAMEIGRMLDIPVSPDTFGLERQQ